MKPSAGTLVHVALGSNLGHRQAHLRRALSHLNRLPQTLLQARSPVYETQPEGPSDRLYLNMAAELATFLSPHKLLDELLAIEQRMGRVRTGKWSDRTIDLDIVLWQDTVMETPRLSIPHPRMHLREFVLRPLCDLSPEAIHPVLNKTVAELLEALGPQTAVRIESQGGRK